MQSGYINIYQSARNNKGYTQEKASELIGVSVESIRAYEAGRTVPQNDVVKRMMGVYDSQHLAYLHVIQSNDSLKDILPQIEIKALPDAVLNLLSKVNAFVKRRDNLIDIASDGKITEDEQPQFNEIIAAIDGLKTALLEFEFSEKK